MTDRRRFLRMFVVLVVFGLGNLVRMIGKPSLEAIRPVDAVQLIGTGMCLGAAILALVLFLRSPRSS
jgi:hypothetical protein